MAEHQEYTRPVDYDGPTFLGHRTLVLHMSGDRPDLREFEAEAKKFCEFHRVPASNIFAVPANTPTASRRAQTIKALQKAKSVDRIVFFGHGWKNGIQLGWNINNTWELIEEWVRLKQCEVRPIEIVLYACSTADGSSDPGDRVGTQGGFADKLRDCLCNRDVIGHVVAHRTAGHTTRNPFLVRCESKGTESGSTYWLVEPQSDLWHTWIERLGRTQFRYQAPFLSIDVIRRYLEMPENEFLRWFQRC